LRSTLPSPDRHHEGAPSRTSGAGGYTSPRRRDDPLDTLTPREREVLTLRAEGRDNTTIAKTLVVTERPSANTSATLGLPPSDSGHRRVLAVLAYLNRDS
jgi:hypothetical protein